MRCSKQIYVSILILMNIKCVCYCSVSTVEILKWVISDSCQVTVTELDADTHFQSFFLSLQVLWFFTEAVQSLSCQNSAVAGGQDDVGGIGVWTYGYPATIQRWRQQPLGQRWLGQREQLSTPVRALTHQSPGRYEGAGSDGIKMRCVWSGRVCVSCYC